MTIALKFAAAMIIFSFAQSGCSKQTPDAAVPETTDDGKLENIIAPSEKADEGPLDDIISIDFPKEAFTFTLAEVAKEVQFGYTITVNEDIDGVMSKHHDVDGVV